MAITFPASPTNGQTFTSGNKTWQWDGTTWLAYGASLSPTVLKVDAANARVGINNQSPAHPLDVIGRVETRAAATQDGVALVGRAGGSSSFDVALTPTTLTADRTLTLPDATGTVALTSDPGLIFIKTQTIGSAVSSVTVTDAFSADYDNYLITVSGGVGSTASFFKMTLGASVTGYYQSRNGLIYATAARSDGTDNNAAAWTAVGTTSTNGLSMYLSVNNPFLAKYTQQAGNYYSAASAVIQAGEHQVATSYSSFTIAPLSGTVTGGTIRVYGYRNS